MELKYRGAYKGGVLRNFTPLLSVPVDGASMGFVKALPPVSSGPCGEPPTSPLCASTGEKDILDLAGWWLGHCLSQHQICSATEGNSFDLGGPSRLLYVGDQPDSNRLSLWNNAEGKATPEKYITLTYCWGKREFARLSKRTFINLLSPSTLRHSLLLLETPSRSPGG